MMRACDPDGAMAAFTRVHPPALRAVTPVFAGYGRV
jgi:hypothetical protein